MSRFIQTRVCRVLSLILALIFGLPSIGLALEEDRGYTAPRLAGRILQIGQPVAAGGEFSVKAGVADPARAEGGGFVLTTTGDSAEGAGLGPDGASCLCGGGIFADGFESGGTAAWSETVG